MGLVVSGDPQRRVVAFEFVQGDGEFVLVAGALRRDRHTVYR